MEEGRTTAAVEGYLDQLACLRGDSPAEPVVRALLSQSVNRLHLLCSHFLHRQYPRLTRPPLNLQTEELLSAVVERLIKALREARPQTVREFFGLASQHMRWELNDLCRRLDKGEPAMHLEDSLVAAPAEAVELQTEGEAGSQRILDAIENLPGDEREVFELVRIQGMTQVLAADVLGVSCKTVQRRLNRALAMLIETLSDLEPVSDRV